MSTTTQVNPFPQHFFCGAQGGISCTSKQSVMACHSQDDASAPALIRKWCMALFGVFPYANRHLRSSYNYLSCADLPSMVGACASFSHILYDKSDRCADRFCAGHDHKSIMSLVVYLFFCAASLSYSRSNILLFRGTRYTKTDQQSTMVFAS